MKRTLGHNHVLLLAFAGPTLLAFATGCSAEVGENPYAAPDKETLAQDEQYMAKLLQGRGNASSMIIDMSDEGQYRFIVHRFLAAGKTQENSPELFRRLEEKHKFLVGTTEGNLGTAISPIVAGACDEALPTSEQKAGSASTFKGSALGNCKNGVDYIYEDLDSYRTNHDGTGYADLNFTYGEEYNGGIGFRVNAPDVTIPTGKVYNLSSMLYASDATGDVAMYALNNSEVANLPVTIAVTHPTEQYNDPTTNSDDPDPENFFLGRTRICIKRGGTDCDYAAINATGQAWTPGPLVGIGVTKLPPSNPWTASQKWIASDYGMTFDTTHVYLPIVGTFDAGTDANGTGCKITGFPPAPASVTAKIFLFDKTGLNGSGATCTVAPDQSAAADGSALLTHLKKQLTAAGGPGQVSTLNFNLLADFGNDCYGYEQRVELVIHIAVNTSCGTRSLTWPGQLAAGNQISPIDLKNSCVAEGTRILRSDGTYVAIERIEPGDRILANQGGVPLTVMGVSRGHEDVPVVRLLDDQGHGLLITAKHPIVTASKGIMRAENLQVGDRVVTEHGVAVVTIVQREEYAGRVYNLSVGNQAELSRLSNPSNQRTMYANGFLIGDGDMQWEMGNPTPNMSVDPLSKLPQTWHKDYLNSLLHRSK